ncbi:MAG: OsmC family protein [Firmicutes bacterium]|nr:OsmC family protein [Bacillota bacterium]
MDVRVSWQGKRRFEAVGDSGHPVTIDAKPDVGGENRGPRPMELLLMGLGGCTGIDVTMILEKMRIPFTSVDIEITGARASKPPEKFTEITLTYLIEAPDAPLDKVQRAVRLSQEAYCSASHSLSADLHAVVVLNGERHVLF